MMGSAHTGQVAVSIPGRISDIIAVLKYKDPVTQTWLPLSTGSAGGTPSPPEVYVGATDPIAGTPSIKSWIDTSVTPPVHKAWDGTQWLTVGSTATAAADEVTVSTTQPVDPANELWYDPDATLLTTLEGWIGEIQSLRARVQRLEGGP